MKETNKITIAGLFLAISMILIIFQIPLPGIPALKLDFSLPVILYSRKYLSYGWTLIIGLFSPLAIILVYGDPIGMLFLMFFNLILISLHNLFFLSNKNISMNLREKFVRIILIIILSIFIIWFLDLYFFFPAYYGFDYSVVFDNYWTFTMIIVVFNLIKLIFTYLIYLIIEKIKI